MELDKENTTLKTIPNDVDKEQKGINVPNLRFNDFNTNWAPVVLSDICSFRKIHRTSTKRDYVSTENILQNYQGIERFSSGAVVSGDGFNCGDILMGNIRPYLKKVYMADFDGVCNSDVLVFKSENVIPEFLHCILANDKFINYVMNSAKGSKMPRGDKQHIMNYPISIPNNAEQSKIANLIDLLNLRVLAQSKIIEDLETLKNKINDTLIYQQGYNKTIPLYELSILKNGYAFKSSSYTENGDFKIITIGNVTGAKFCDTKECNKIQYIPKDIQSHQKLKKNDILISLTGNVGRVSLCNEDNCLLNQRVGILELHSDVNREFIYQCLSNKKFEQAMICKGQGAAQLNIGKSDIESFDIPLFDKKYQEYVSSVLSFYDTKIQKEKDMLELYKKQKAYLLQNMFI